MSNVRYDKALREHAKKERKFLVTVAVDGREVGEPPGYTLTAPPMMVS